MNTKGTAGTTGTAGARPHWRCLPAMAGETARAGMSHAPPPLRPSAVFFASPFRVFRVFRGSRPSAPICVICGYILRLFLSWFSWRLGGSILSLCASLWLIFLACAHLRFTSPPLSQSVLSLIFLASWRFTPICVHPCLSAVLSSLVTASWSSFSDTLLPLASCLGLCMSRPVGAGFHISV